MPFRPKRSDTHTNPELLDMKLNGSPKSESKVVDNLETKANGV